MTPISYPDWKAQRAAQLTAEGVIIECGHCAGTGHTTDLLCAPCYGMGYFENAQAAIPSERLCIRVYEAEVTDSIKAWGEWTRDDTAPLLGRLSEYVQSWRAICN